MRTSTRTTTRTITTGKVLTAQHRKAIRALTKSSAPAKTTISRLEKLLVGFRSRAKQLAKSNGKKRHA